MNSPTGAGTRLAGALLIGLCGASALDAQPTRTDPVDRQGWYGVGLTIDLPKKWATELDWRVGYQNDASTWLGSYLKTGVSRGFGKHWSVEGSYRLAKVGGRNYQRVATGPSWDRSVHKWKLGVRALVQHQRQSFDGNDETGGDADTFIRTRLQLRHAVTKWLRGYVSTEPYFAPGADFPVDNWRNTIGTEWDLGNGRALDVFYIYRPDYGKRSYNRTFHIVGMQLDLDWKPRRRKGS